MRKNSSFILLLSISILLFSQLSYGSEQEQAQGQLKIKGSDIEQLILRDQKGQQQTINNPEEIITLLVGRYTIEQVKLKNGLMSNHYENIQISEDKEAVLTVGAPFIQTIEVSRQGRSLVMNYSLTGQGGESYYDQTRTQPPMFTVYKGDKVIASGNFEYG